MTTQITQTNGNIIATIPDYSTNNTASSIILSGRGSMNVGAVMQDNMIGILENFSYPTPPKNPLVGQLWYQPYSVDNNNNQTQVKRLNLYIDDFSVSINGWIELATLSDVSSFQGQIDNINSEIAAINSNINGNNTNLQNQINTIDATLTNLQSQITDNKNNISGLQQNISTINGQISTIDGQISTIDTTLTNLQSQITDNKNSIVATNDNFQNYLPLSGGTLTGDIIVNANIKTSSSLAADNISSYTSNGTTNFNNNVNFSEQVTRNNNPSDTPTNITNQIPNTWWVNQYYVSKSDFSGSTISNIVLPGGIRMQMFYANIPNGGRVTFPTAFSGTPSGLQITVAQNVDADHYFVNLNSTGCNIGYFGNQAPTVNFCIFVIGPA